MSRVAPVSIWEEIDGDAVAATARQLFWVKGADGFMRLSQWPDDVTHYWVETVDGFLEFDTSPTGALRAVRIGGFVVAMPGI